MTSLEDTLKEGVFENSEFCLLRQLIEIFSDVSLSAFVEDSKSRSKRPAQPRKAFEFDAVLVGDDCCDGAEEEFEDLDDSDNDEGSRRNLTLVNKTPEVDAALKALEDFKRLYQNEYKLSEHKLFDKFDEFFTHLINNCVCSDNWLPTCEWSSRSIYLILYSLRILLRSMHLQKKFLLAKNSVSQLTRLLLKYCAVYTSLSSQLIVHAHILDQLLNILTKIVMANSSVSTDISKVFFEANLHVALMQLIGMSTDLCLIHGSLNLFIYIVSNVDNKLRLVNDLDISDQLLLMLQEYDEDSKKFASKLLSSLCSEEKIKFEITHLDGIQILLSLLHNEYSSMDILWNIIWCLVQLSSFEENKREIRLMGGMPLILSLLKDKGLEAQLAANNTDSSNSNQNSSSNQNKAMCPNESEENQALNNKRSKGKYQIQAACCALIGELAFNETNSYQIVNTNGVYLVASKLLTRAAPAQSSTTNSSESLVNDNSAESSNKEIERLHCNAWRTLRILFSAERHRSLIKKIIPFNMFEQFVDIGNYKKDLNKYQPLLDSFYKLSKEDYETIKQQIKFINQTQSPTNYINDYAVYEIIGSGAFGRVHKVKKKNSNYFLAMKEINTYNLTSMKDKSLGEIVNEVTIIRNNLKHPNIVRYMKTFKENDSLFIVMELIDGAPLSQHVRTLKEKQEHWTEEKIWNLFIQIVLALKYLHKEKHIVHRDLTSNNIMLSENDKITITDFGLAKLKESNCSKMLSVVGTMFYSCPEIVKNEPYNEKADIWALGCVLYEICCLEPPFCTSNMLALATKITQADYDQTRLSLYSPLILAVVQSCLVVEPLKRPDIIGVAGLVAEKILTYTDTVRYKCNNLEKKLEKEKNRTQKMLCTKQDRTTSSLNSYQSQMSKASTENDPMNGSNNSGCVLHGNNSGPLLLSQQSVTNDVKVSPCNSDTMQAVNHIRANIHRSASITASSPSSSRKNSTAEGSSTETVVTNKPKIPTPSQPVAITKSQPVNAQTSPNAKLPPLRNPKSKIIMKTIQNKKKEQQKHQEQQQQQQQLQAMSSKSQQIRLESEKSQFLTSNAAGSSVEEHHPNQPLNSAPTNNSLEADIVKQKKAGEHQETRQRPVNPKMQRSTSSSILEKHSTQSKKNRPNSANTPVYKKLRPIEDPILPILDQLHKIIFITQLPPRGTKNFKQKLVDRYKRYLFSNKHSSIQIKSEVMKLVKFSTEIIDMETIGLKSFQYSSYNSSDSSSNRVSSGYAMASVAASSAPVASNSKNNNEFNVESLTSEMDLIFSQNGITYEQLQNIIEELLMQNNYHEENLKFLREELPAID